MTPPATGIRPGCRDRAIRGRGSVARRYPRKEAAVRELLSGGIGIVKAAKLAGVGVSVVQRIKAAMTGVA